MTNKDLEKKRTRCEIFSRICGYLRPISQWNKGKAEEWLDRKLYKVDEKDLKEEKDDKTK